MPPTDDLSEPLESHESHDALHCAACQSALTSADRQTVSFLLVDDLTVPLVGCGEHLEQFTEFCGFTTDETARLFSHRPAGGIRCPGCRLASHNSQHVMIPIGGGATGVLACPEHQSELIGRFQTGLQTQKQLNSNLRTFPST